MSDTPNSPPTSLTSPLPLHKYADARFISLVVTFVCACFALVTIVSIAIATYLPTSISDSRLNEATTIVGTTFSILAFVGLIYTIFLQQNELHLQRDEMRQSREEYAKLAESSAQSEKRLFLTAYLNAIQNLAELTADVEPLDGTESTQTLADRARRWELRARLESLLPALDEEFGKTFGTAADSDAGPERELVWLLSTAATELNNVSRNYSLAHFERFLSIARSQLTNARNMIASACLFVEPANQNRLSEASGSLDDMLAGFDESPPTFNHEKLNGALEQTRVVLTAYLCNY